MKRRGASSLCTYAQGWCLTLPIMDFWQHFFGFSHENNNVPVHTSPPPGEYGVRGRLHAPPPPMTGGGDWVCMTTVESLILRRIFLFSC